MENSLTSGIKNSNMETAMEAAIGLSDGLVVPFVLVAALSAAADTAGIIWTAGLVQVGTGALAMAWAGYQAAKAGTDAPVAGEKNETGRRRNKEVALLHDVKAYYAHLGFPEDLQERAAAEVLKDEAAWKELLKIDPPSQSLRSLRQRARKSAGVIGLSYAAGGLVPLSPYFYFNDPLTALKYATAGTLVLLFAFGWVRSKVVGAPPLPGALRITLMSALAAGAAYWVAGLF